MPHNIVLSNSDREQVFGMLSFVFNSIDDGPLRYLIERGAHYMAEHGRLHPEPGIRKAVCTALSWYAAGVRLTIKAMPHHVSVSDIGRLNLLTQLIYAWKE